MNRNRSLCKTDEQTSETIYLDDRGERISTTLPLDSLERKEFPLFRGVFRYFPAALAGVARVSKVGNDKHNPGEEMHHSRGKSSDHADCIARHLMDVEENGGIDPTSGLPHVDNLVWRAMALAQEWHEAHGAPLAPGAKVTPVDAPVDNLVADGELAEKLRDLDSRL